MGFIGFISIFLLGMFISFFSSRIVVIVLLILSLSSIAFYFYGPSNYSKLLDTHSYVFNGGPESSFYKNVDKIKVALHEVKDEHDKSLKLDENNTK